MNGKEAAGCGDGVDAIALDHGSGGGDEGLFQPAGLAVDDSRNAGPRHDADADRERPGRRIAGIAGQPGKLRVEHQYASRTTLHVACLACA